MESKKKLETEMAGMEAKVEGMLEGAEAKVQAVEHEVEDAVKRIQARLLRKVERITAVAEEEARGGQASTSGRKTFPSFLAKVMAEAESGADAKQIDRMLSGLTVEQRLAVKMQMVKAGMM